MKCAQGCNDIGDHGSWHLIAKFPWDTPDPDRSAEGQGGRTAITPPTICRPSQACALPRLLMPEGLASSPAGGVCLQRIPRVPAVPSLHSPRVWGTAGLKCPPAVTVSPSHPQRAVQNCYGLRTPMGARKHPSIPSHPTCTLTTLKDDLRDKSTVQFPKIN